MNRRNFLNNLGAMFVGVIVAFASSKAAAATFEEQFVAVSEEGIRYARHCGVCKRAYITDDKEQMTCSPCLLINGENENGFD